MWFYLCKIFRVDRFLEMDGKLEGGMGDICLMSVGFYLGVMEMF